ncbi:MAG: hypothetical protein AAF125_10205, partial [Chloroflexota bacterium]
IVLSALAHLRLGHLVRKRAITLSRYRLEVLLAAIPAFLALTLGIPQLLLFLIGPRLLRGWLPTDVLGKSTETLPRVSHRPEQFRMMRDVVFALIFVAVLLATTNN